MKATQENREIEIITPLGKDVLLLQGFTVTEKLGRLFTLNAELLSVDDVVFEDILGQNVDIRVDLPEGERFFNGYISSFSQDSHDGTYARYQATIHPWFWFLTRSSDCRIFQNKTVPEIIRKVCSDLGFTDISDKLSGEYRQWEYCVQYRETNFNFLSRLMEQEGIYYYFSHEKGKHTLNLCDCYSSHEVLPDNKEIPYDPEQGAIANKEDSIHHWLVTKEIQSGMYALNEYDSTRPKMNEHVDSSIIQKHANADFELYDYPGEYVEPSDGRHYAKIRIEEQQTKYELLQGQSNVKGLLLGGLFSLADYPREDQNREYLLDSITQSIYTSDFVASGGGSSSSYSNSFTVINSQTSFRSARITPKPIVQGAQTAIVVGPAGEEIYTEKDDGRVKVQFYWDRYGKADENSSCWVRVSQMWAGAKWGGMHIPHVGHEVIVSFLEGDPDRPIITGRVYNGINTPADALPAEKTKSVIRSFGDNDIVIEDKEGDKSILIKQACGNEIRMHENTPDIEIKQECGNEVLMKASGPDIEIKQKCGNEMLMREAEGIQIRDKFGNEIVMDAVAGTMKIRSPSHESVIELGKSLWFGTLSDMRKEVEGNEYSFIAKSVFTTIHGLKDEHVIGPVRFKYDGANIKIHGGFASDTFIGAKHSSTFGASYTFNKGLHVVKVGNKALIDSAVETKIIGGGGTFDTSKMILNGDEVVIECISAKITLKQGGDIKIESPTNINILAEGNINIVGNAVNKFEGSKNNFSGEIDHKNINIKG